MDTAKSLPSRFWVSLDTKPRPMVQWDPQTFVLGTYSTRCCLECWTNDYGVLKNILINEIKKNALTTNIPTHQAHIAGLKSRN